MLNYFTGLQTKQAQPLLIRSEKVSDFPFGGIWDRESRPFQIQENILISDQNLLSELNQINIFDIPFSLTESPGNNISEIRQGSESLQGLSGRETSYKAHYDYSVTFSTQSPTGVGSDFAPLSPNELSSQLGTRQNFDPLGVFNFDNISFVTGRSRSEEETDTSASQEVDSLQSNRVFGGGPIAAPVAIQLESINDSYTTRFEQGITISALNGIHSNDQVAYANGSRSTLANYAGVRSELVNYAGGGTLTLNPDGSFSYTPAPGYLGVETFTYRLSDGTLISNTSTVSLTVLPANRVPQAVNDTYTVNEDTPLVVGGLGILGNDSDPDLDAITASLVGNVSNGSLTLNANGSFTYTPNANFTGTDSFTYRANDGSLNSAPATVTITVAPVNDAPVAVNDTANTTLNNAVNIDLQANDTDAEDGVPTGTPTLVSGPNNGSVVINALGEAVYTPNNGFTGMDSFTYRAVDSDGTPSGNIATATVTVSAVANDPPTAPSRAVNVVEDSQNNDISLAAPTDPDGDALTITVVSLPDPVKGEVTLANGTEVTVGQTLTLSELQNLQYDAALNATGTGGNFVYSVSDGVNPPVNGTVAFNISPVNDAPRISLGDNESFGFTDAVAIFFDDFRPDNSVERGTRAGVQTLSLETAEIIMQESRNVSVEFISENSAEAGSLGWYKIDGVTGEIQNPEIIWDNLDGGSLAGGTTASLGALNEGDRIGFFMVNDGFNQNNFDNPAGANYIDLANGELFFGTNPGGASATIFDAAPSLWYVPTGNPAGAFQINTSASGIYHTEAYQGLGNLSLNPDGEAHSKGGARHSDGDYLIGFEQNTSATSSNTTFDDYVFRVDLGQKTTQELFHGGNFRFEIKDVDSTQLRSATFRIADTPHPDNESIGITGYDVSGSFSSGSIAGTGLFINGLGTRSVSIFGTADIDVYESVLSSLRIFRSATVQHPYPRAPGGSFPYVYRPGERDLEVSVTDTDGVVSNIMGPSNEGDPFNDISAYINVVNSYTSRNNNDNNYGTSLDIGILGNSGNDTLTASGNLVVIDGGEGDDIINGANRSTGHDTLLGSSGEDRISGNAGDDIIFGGRDNDTIFGGTGDDYVAGGLGSDRISLGSGDDYVVFLGEDVGSGVDTITDFNTSQDVIDLSDVLDYQGGNLDFWVRAENTGGSVTVSVDVDGTANGENFVDIATLTTNIPAGQTINIDYGGVAPIEVV